MFLEESLEVYDDIEFGQWLWIIQILGIRWASKLFSEKKQDCEADTIGFTCCSFLVLVFFRLLVARHESRASCVLVS